MTICLLDTDTLSEVLKSKGATRQLQQFAIFCQHSAILTVSEAILDQAADLWVTAHKAGIPKNDADLIIAATAFDSRRILVTGNTVHFSWIPGRMIENWRKS